MSLFVVSSAATPGIRITRTNRIPVPVQMFEQERRMASLEREYDAYNDRYVTRQRGPKVRWARRFVEYGDEPYDLVAVVVCREAEFHYWVKHHGSAVEGIRYVCVQHPRHVRGLKFMSIEYAPGWDRVIPDRDKHELMQLLDMSLISEDEL
jgi:hypothetical protein